MSYLLAINRFYRAMQEKTSGTKVPDEKSELLEFFDDLTSFTLRLSAHFTRESNEWFYHLIYRKGNRLKRLTFFAFSGILPCPFLGADKNNQQKPSESSDFSEKVKNY